MDTLREGSARTRTAPSTKVTSLNRDASKGEFFILRRYRRQGIGERAARMLFDHFPGRWTVYTFPQNIAARAFWHGVIGRYTHGQLTTGRWEGYGGLGYTWSFLNGSSAG